MTPFVYPYSNNSTFFLLHQPFVNAASWISLAIHSIFFLLYAFLLLEAFVKCIDLIYVKIAVFLNTISSLCAIYFAFNKFGTQSGLDTFDGRLEYTLLCLGVHFTFIAAVFINLSIGLTILPEDFVAVRLRKVTILTFIFDALEGIAILSLIWLRLTKTVSSFFRSLTIVSFGTVFMFTFHFNVILNGVISFVSKAIVPDELLKEQKEQTESQKFILSKFKRIKGFRLRLLLIMLILFCVIFVLCFKKNVAENAFFLFLFTLSLQLLNAGLLSIYFPLTAKIIKEHLKRKINA